MAYSPSSCGVSEVCLGFAERRHRGGEDPCGCQNSATAFDQGLYPACSYSLMSPPSTRRRLIGSWERAGDEVVGLRRQELAARGLGEG
jgi:hypothetical protein